MFSASTSAEAQRSQRRWFPHNKGGAFKRWFGNQDYLVDWENNGERIKQLVIQKYPYLNGNPNFVVHDDGYYFSPFVSWSEITSSATSFQLFPTGFTFNIKGMSAFPSDGCSMEQLLALCNSTFVSYVTEILNPSLSFGVGDFNSIPAALLEHETIAPIVTELVGSARADWDNFETSWDFRDFPLLRDGKSGLRIEGEGESGESGTKSSFLNPNPFREGESRESGTAPSSLFPAPCLKLKDRTLAESWQNYANYCAAAIRRMQELETENNRLFIAAYGLEDELEPEVPEKQITLARADEGKDMAAFLSYAVGCMMGRYSLDAPGLILANAGDTLEDYLRVVNEKRQHPEVPSDQLAVISGGDLRFAPDVDAIVPILDGDWFDDDITERFKKFLKASFGDAHYEENLTWLENALFPGNLEGKKRKTIRDYFLKDFYNEHVKTYKKRPIYWLFSSPKGSFNALVYLQRYTKSTVSLVLNDYLREFKTKLTAKQENLQHLEASSSPSPNNK